MRPNLIAFAVLIVAAILEVSGDAFVRRGLRGRSFMYIMFGFAIVALYAVVVNLLPWEFSRILGVYVAVFAFISVLVGHFVFREGVSISTRVGLALIAAGALVIQFGQSARV